ncbi:hypothetical protein [uncultured Shewanella sp.]|uniref:hypothetical protein n=1 Tax=uncultured Shewanella sp. TaxID=173975 RepID=UPI00262540FA|nr:hypothetical protein [uncultured Shewanella sp.]
MSLFIKSQCLKTSKYIINDDYVDIAWVKYTLNRYFGTVISGCFAHALGGDALLSTD